MYISTMNINIPENSLLAVSGGADSMAMLHYARYTPNITVAHVNYNIRPDSIKDQHIVADFCVKYNIPLHIKYNIDPIPTSGIELWARNLRYDFFSELTNLFDIQYIVTAHHKNDQAETVIMKIMRGTGLKGLRGIHQQKDNIIRPVLNITKTELYEYCRNNKVKYREDSTNSDINYTRNYVRHNIINKMNNADINTLCNIADKAQILYPKILAKLHDKYGHLIRTSDREITINKQIPLDDLSFIYIAHRCEYMFEMNHHIYARMKSTNPNMNAFNITTNILCDKRKKEFISMRKL